MIRKLYLVLSIALLAGIQPVFAQTDGATIIDLNLATDDEFSEALGGASTIELINENELEEETAGDDSDLAEGTSSARDADTIAAGSGDEDATPQTVTVIADAEGTTDGEDAEPQTVTVIVDTEEETIVTETEIIIVEEDADGTTTVIIIAEEEIDTIDTEAIVIADEDTGDEPAARPEIEVPYNISNNQYFRESQRLAKLAEETYSYGDYDASTALAQEAIHYTLLSDVHVAIAIAKTRLDWAVSSGASKQYPTEFQEAEEWYGESLSARDAEDWESAIEAAHKVIDILAYIGAPDGTFPLPARYTVRTWVTVRDCLWNIAGRSWVYGNPHLWRQLYEANKSKFPNPDNPNLIEPGMVLDIPSIRGETRQGEWSSNRTYGSVR